MSIIPGLQKARFKVKSLEEMMEDFPFLVCISLPEPVTCYNPAINHAVFRQEPIKVIGGGNLAKYTEHKYHAILKDWDETNPRSSHLEFSVAEVILGHSVYKEANTIQKQLAARGLSPSDVLCLVEVVTDTITGNHELNVFC